MESAEKRTDSGQLKVQTNTYSEGSKREKWLKANDAEALKDHCHDTIHETPPGPTLDAASLASSSSIPSGLGAKGIDLSTMLPDQSEKMSGELEKVIAAMAAAVDKIKESLERCHQIETSAGQQLARTC